ncbi:MAG: molybdate ABC transporter substrate-binding protein [Armatimonadota bacterium]
MAETTPEPRETAQSEAQGTSPTRVLTVGIIIAALIAAAIIVSAGRKKQQASLPTPPGAAPSATEVVCLVPCGLQGPYGKIKDLYAVKRPDVKITQEVQNTALLVRGIESGKFTGDVLFTLGDREIAYLRERGKIQGEATSFAENSIAVLVPRDNPARLRPDHFADVASERVKHMGLPSPDINSVGYYAQQALQNAGLWEKLEGRIVRRDEPSRVGKLAAQKRIQCGILYASCLLESDKPGGEPTPRKKTKGLAEVPHEYYDRFYCQAAVLAGAKAPAAARDFIRFWLSDEAQKVLQEAGFGRVSEATIASAP